MTTFVLVHGAWFGAWSWEKVVPALAARGHAARAIDLPGHGDDPRAPAEADLMLYANRIVEEIDSLDEPAILVGHSMGGMAISAAAALRPGKVAGLVYVCAFLPRDGESLLAIETRNPNPTIPPLLIHDDAHTTARLPEDALDRLFFHDCPAEDAARARARLQPQGLKPLAAPVTLGPAFDALAKDYVVCTEDGGISPALQRDMASATPGVRLHELATGHCPFYADPQGLAGLLDRIARA